MPALLWITNIKRAFYPDGLTTSARHTPSSVYPVFHILGDTPESLLFLTTDDNQDFCYVLPFASSISQTKSP